MSLQETLAVIRKSLEHKTLPISIAIIAFFIFLPTIKSGLMLDDLIHRSILIDPDRLPPEIYRTGLMPGKTREILYGHF